jgi:cytochrome c biogenesis protein CcmG/thiol:disulfide interchange protein DsbE
MARRKLKKRSSKSAPQILAMLLIGTGLLLLGGLALVMIPKLNSSANAQEKSAGASEGSLPSSVPAVVDFPAPDLTLSNLDGDSVALSDFKSQVVLVNNWATWCPPCKAEMPTLQAYFEDYQDQGFEIVAIEAGDPVSQVAAFAKDYGLSFHVWPDPDQKALIAFRNTGLPNSYVIDKQGQVRLAWTGAISRDMLDKYVTPLLED